MRLQINVPNRSVTAIGLANKEIPAVLAELMSACAEHFGPVPLDVTIHTHDEHYGDVLADAAVLARVRPGAWNVANRIAKWRAR